MSRPLLITVTLFVYAALMAAVVWAMIDARARMATMYDTPEEQANWEQVRDDLDRRHEQREAFRAEVAQATKQPIEPAQPKQRSPRPPALELLQNHFIACLVTTIVGVTLLFAVIWGLLVGAIFRPGRRIASFDGKEAEIAEPAKQGAVD